ncbi:MAG: hypothetical protein Q9175_001673, partial [Cornicularia normoerica]
VEEAKKGRALQAQGFRKARSQGIANASFKKQVQHSWIVESVDLGLDIWKFQLVVDRGKAVVRSRFVRIIAATPSERRHTLRRLIADVGLRLSITLYTSRDIVASADRSVISISKDVSFASKVIKALGQILDKDMETRTFSETAIQIEDGVSMRINNLLKEVDEAQYKITLKSRLRVKGGIAGPHECEIQELELPRMNRFAARDHVKMFSLGDMRHEKTSPSMVATHGPDSREQEAAAVWSPQATPDARLFYTRTSTMVDPIKMPNSVNEAAAKQSRTINLSELDPSDKMARAYTMNDSIPESGDGLLDKKCIRTSDDVSKAVTDNARIEELSAPIAEATTKTAAEVTKGARVTFKDV